MPVGGTGKAGTRALSYLASQSMGWKRIGSGARVIVSGPA